MVSNMRLEMDSLSSDLKVSVTLLIILLCLLEKIWGRTLHGSEDLWVWNIFHTERRISKKKKDKSNLFFYLCIRNGKSIFNYMGKVDQGLTYQTCWDQGWRINLERSSIYCHLGGINILIEERDWNLSSSSLVWIQRSTVWPMTCQDNKWIASG